MHGGTLKIVECVLGVFSAPVLSRTPYFKESKLGGVGGDRRGIYSKTDMKELRVTDTVDDTSEWPQRTDNAA